MATMMRDYLMATLPELRYEATSRRIRVLRGDRTIADTTDAVLVWEPEHIVPGYAVPEDALDAKLVPASKPGPSAAGSRGHTATGQGLDVEAESATLPSAAFRPDDPDLAGYVMLDFASFDWLEEEEPIVGHPHDPFKRIDTLRSSRHVVVSLDGVVLAESHRPVALLETHLPTRWYLPRDDVRMDLLERSDLRTTCAYKGHASYLSVIGAGEAGRALAWSYPEPLHDATPVRDMVCFYAERSDLSVDGEPVPRPVTPWST